MNSQRKLMQLAGLAGIVGALAVLTAAPINAQPVPTPRIVGYFTSWGIYDPGYRVTDIPVNLLTHINYAFANVSAEGEVIVGDPQADTLFAYPGDIEGAPLLGNFHQLQLLKAAHPGLQTLISVGGWSWSGNFSDAALTAESRARFARSAVDFIIRYGFDGVDIDWEYPTGGGLSGNTVRPQDPENLVLLLAELRAQLDARGAQDGRPYLLTIASAAGNSAVTGLDWPNIHPSLDWINVMTYDFSGSWSDVTGFNAPLFDSTDRPPEGGSADATIQGMLVAGVPADKLVLGVPFFGKGWGGVDGDNDGLHQPFTTLAFGNQTSGMLNYSDIAATFADTATRFWDARAQVPWLYSAQDGVMISYDDAESLALKAQYARENGLGGIMIWELGQDTMDNALLSALHTVLNAP